MKLTKARLKQIIKEELEVQDPSPLPPPEFTDYEVDDMDTDSQMVMLLKEIVGQLKMLNHQMTPAKGFGASGVEKAISGLTVAEGKE